MKSKSFVCVASMLAMVGWAQTSPMDAKVRDACAALLRNARDAAAQDVIKAAAVEDTLPPAMRSRAMALCALPCLQQMNTNQFSRMAQALLAAYPEDGPAVLGVTVSDWLVACPACDGVGGKAAVCPACSGAGKCPACKGTKKTPAGAACPGCKGEGGCARCEGAKEIRVTCLDCRSAGQVVKISPNVKSRYEAVLAELKALASENVQFAEQSQKALALRNPKERLAALEEALAAFPARQDVAPLVRARDAIRAEMGEAAERAQAQEARARLLQERNALFDAARDLPHSSIPALIRRIDIFIAEHPKSAHETELELLKVELDARRASRASRWMWGSIIGGAIAALFVLSLAKDYVLGLNRKTERAKLPGMDAIDPDQFTDPLSDTRDAAAKRRGREE